MSAEADPVYPPWGVAQVVAGPFFRYRGLEPAAPLPSHEAAVERLERDQYLRLDARRRAPRGRRDLVVVLVLAPGGAPSRFSPDFKAMVDRVRHEKAFLEGTLDELIVIAHPELFGQTHIVEAFFGGYQREEVEGPDPEGRAPFYNAYPCWNFVLEIPAHVSVAPHRVVGPEEEAALLARTRRADLPVIFHNDPPVVWLGARPGQIVRIDAPSHTAGFAVVYRRVVRNAKPLLDMA